VSTILAEIYITNSRCMSEVQGKDNFYLQATKNNF